MHPPAYRNDQRLCAAVWESVLNDKHTFSNINRGKDLKQAGIRHDKMSTEIQGEFPVTVDSKTLKTEGHRPPDTGSPFDLPHDHCLMIIITDQCQA